MRRFMTKRVALIGVVGALLVGGAAYAGLTLTGTGTGSGTTTGGTPGTAPVSISVHIAPTPALVPGGSSTVTFNGTNAGTSPVKVTTISFVSVTSADPGCQNLINTAALGANAVQFSMPTVAENQVVPPSSTIGFTALGTLSWANWVTPFQDQSACVGKPLTLNVATP
jgi:hypothetical protein